MVHYRSKSLTNVYKTPLYLQAKIGHKANQNRAAKPTASPLLAVQGMYTNRRTRTNMSISSNTLFTLLSVTRYRRYCRLGQFPPCYHSKSIVGGQFWVAVEGGRKKREKKKRVKNMESIDPLPAGDFFSSCGEKERGDVTPFYIF
ncbi:hypothetical protein GW17_00016813 [Ensete ventricosum]|nr:hypothetical protein GW17_00016813 [Ensete ventricosum]